MAETRNNASVASSLREYSPLVIAGALLLAALACFYLSGQAVGGSADAPLPRFGLALESLNRGGQDLVRGVAPDFTSLGATLKTAESDLQQLRNGPAAAQADVGTLTETWKPVRENGAAIVAAEAAFRRAAGNAAAVGGSAPALSASYEQIADRLASKGAPSGQIYLVASQLIRIERLQGAAGRVLASGTVQAAAEGIDREAKTFARNNRALLEPVQGLDFAPVRDSVVEAAAKQVTADFSPALKAAADLVEDAPAVAKAQQAAAGLKAALPAAFTAQRRLAQSHLADVAGSRQGSGSGNGLNVAGYVCVVLALIAIASYIALVGARRRERAKLSAERDAQQQQAILGLLDEITNLANGDLTVDVTVTEDFTGAIADSINYTVQTLRGLVGTINQTSTEIVTSASATRDSATRMSRDSDRQAREITEAAATIVATSGQLGEVADRAERIAVQAQTSVQVAHGGAGTVGRTIQSMTALREQIQDTAKRIKRLGESSQEIGNITELINDIAEQTNTLALNASIQAAMAGDAGRGFAVVADEVQRLAERATSATRQIENLVKTIQADTNEAIISMERSTANVVSGARSAEEAGLSLTRVETSSQELANSIQAIALSAREQSAEANKVAGVMQDIRQIAVQTAGSADRTSQDIGELNVLSDKLRESVAGFKLPA